MVPSTSAANSTSDAHQQGSAAAPGLAGYDDDALMARAQDGDKEAYEVIVSRHMETATALATRFLASPGAGRDAARDAFIELWVARTGYRCDGNGNFRSHLATLVVDVCRTRGLQSGASAGGSQGETDNEMERALAQLDHGDRELLMMRYGMDLAYQELASKTGRPTDAVRSRVFESLRKLKHILEGES